MIFSTGELRCFNSILDNKKLFGIKLDEKYDNEEEYISKIIDSLKIKSILDENSKLTDIGVLPILALREYKNSRNHIIINNFNIALLKDGKSVVIKKEEEGYRIFFCSRELILFSIIYSSNFMRKESKDNDNVSTEKIQYLKLLIDEKYKRKNSITLSWYFCTEKVTEKIYSWSDEDGYIYDVINSNRKVMSPKEMRLSLMEDLRIIS